MREAVSPGGQGGQAAPWPVMATSKAWKAEPGPHLRCSRLTQAPRGDGHLNLPAHGDATPPCLGDRAQMCPH